MNKEQLKELLKENWIGKEVSTSDGKKWEVVDHDNDRVQVIPTGLGFHSPRWFMKSEVTK